MRLLVGTLYTIENEFEECCHSIKRQSYPYFDHYVFKNLPNKEAHVTLFKSFVEKANEYDLLVKVDADMVLIRPSLFEEIVEKLRKNCWAQILSIAVHDFFSDELIWGLNAYRNSVRWNFEKELLFVDRPEVPPERYLMDSKELAPAAYHCSNPSPYQAFHYGVHRGLKVIQPGQSEKKEESSKAHWNSLERTWANFQKTRDLRIGLAALGAELAYTGRFRISDLDYSNPYLSKILGRYLALDYRALAFEIKRLRFLNWGVLPSTKRRRLLCRLSEAHNRIVAHRSMDRGTG